MGNNHTKEERPDQSRGSASGQGGSHLAPGRPGEGSSSRRPSRPDLSVLGLTTTSSREQDVPFERRETRQEREARKLEKERAARLKERERSMKEENVDGGFLVTMGVYTGIEDFSKPTVRQLQIERKIAPFWRGLDDFKDTWAEHQIIAAARGLEIPPPDEVPDHLRPQPLNRPLASTDTSSSNLRNLTVPMGGRTLSSSSDRAGSTRGSALPSPTSPVAPKSSSPLKQPKKALAAALSLSRNSSQADIAPRELNSPADPFVNGQPVEVFLYKEGEECPLCLMYYPPYLNRTRCCCQLICSECFVQIKRPDPHLPDHHDENGGQSQPSAEEQQEQLIMEPAKCPYCTQTDFGITYEPPPFRRGLTYAVSSGFGALSPAMSSSSSINSSLSPTTAGPSTANRKRAQSVAANAPGVVTTDRIRPDWAGKLAAARAHQRRRAAAADALHHAAFVMGGQESRSLFGRSSRFSRRPAGTARGTDSPASNQQAGTDDTSPPWNDPNMPSAPARHRERLDAAHLEQLMMAEAIRLSLADEEDRRKKADKEARKEAKKKEKEEKKAAKKKGDVYGGGGGSSASVSSLSLGFGRRRGNSNVGNLRVEASVAAATATAQVSDVGSSQDKSQDKGKGVERGATDEGASPSTDSPSLPIPMPPRATSHLRQMSNASSISSSGLDSMPGSYAGRNPIEDPLTSGLSLSAQSDQGENPSSEPLFNFRSLAEVVGVSIDGEGERIDGEQGSSSKTDEHEGTEHVEHVAKPAGNETIDTAKLHTQGLNPVETLLDAPNVIVTPETPAPLDDDHGESKQLGNFNTSDRSSQVTQ
ncbi:hypothetical protein F5Y18DRAFT_273578 [Xylariaceae sp. FL1019]|nr:hypothetical protein F5Y18DRAFT_273578 [Xylariaceae sp. FL1019]